MTAALGLQEQLVVYPENPCIPLRKTEYLGSTAPPSARLIWSVKQALQVSLWRLAHCPEFVQRCCCPLARV